MSPSPSGRQSGRLIDRGLVDVPARPGKGDHPFTYWDYRAGMFHKDMGMRIDLVLASPVCTSSMRTSIARRARASCRPTTHRWSWTSTSTNLRDDEAAAVSQSPRPVTGAP